MSTKPPPRLVDVATRAGVHVSTASRVLNGSVDSKVRDETRQRVHAAAAELKYRPNALARGLKTSTTTTLGLLVRSLSNPVMADMARAAAARAWELGYVVVIAEDDGVITERAWERLVDEGRIDGMLVASASIGGPILDFVDQASLPHVFVDHVHPGSGRNVAMREADAGRMAAEHLLALGHHHFGQITGPPAFDSDRRRSEAFRETVLAAGDPAPVRWVADYTEASASEAAKAIFAAKHRPTAVFVSALSHAIGFVATAQHAGIRIPDEMSLICYDDDPLLDYVGVPVTSIRMPMAELGRVATGALIDQIDGKAPRDIEIPTLPIIVPRSSTTAPTGG
ncbi:MAG: LacI family transcriptional regulator [Thermoleophilia bacterium]|nr:LacI family transcriptional regulator [Thermoleophilia bacterium]